MVIFVSLAGSQIKFVPICVEGFPFLNHYVADIRFGIEFWASFTQRFLE
jgi:hypothetical protein